MQGSSWFSWFTFPFFAPLSGAVTQDLSSHAYRGIPEIETDVIQNAGSFGRQLGILTDTVVDLANRLEKADPSFAPLLQVDGREEAPLTKLRVLKADVDAIKEKHKAAAKREAEDALKRLRIVDPDGFKVLQAQFRVGAEQ